MNRILAVIRSVPNSALVVQTLQEHDVRITREIASLDGADLVILDGLSYPDNRAELIRARKNSSPIFLPVVLLLAESVGGAKPLGADEPIDDILRYPVRREELRARIAHLLTIRRQSIELDDERAELEETNAALQHLSDELAKKNRELSAFAHVVAHDLNAPLGVMMGYLQILQRDLPDPQQPLFDRIFESGRRMAEFIRRLVDLYRSGRIVSDVATIDLQRAFVEQLDVVRAPDVEVELNCETRERVVGDPFRIYQLLQNLLGNAIGCRHERRPLILTVTAEPCGEPVGVDLKPRPEVDPKCRKKGAAATPAETKRHCGDEGKSLDEAARKSMVRCCLSDNGRGIDPEHLPEIFELGVSRGGGRSGSGLGLALCKRIVEAHGGRIWMESDGVDRGARVLFTLPRAERKEEYTDHE